jgi:predicted metal-dependent hydrolase
LGICYNKKMNTNSDLPLVVAFVDDLMFTTRIQNVVRGLGYRINWIGRAADIGGEVNGDKNKPGESLEGRSGRLFELITAWQPAVLIFDLTNEAVPWQYWIATLKSSAATRRIPIVAFGPHTDVELMGEAKRVGADVVLARSRFTADMPALLQKYARIPSYETINADCDELIAPLALQGIEKFNRGEFYDCHDDLEEAWRQDESAVRDLYRAIVQVAIAYYQIEKKNYRGAVKMFLRVRQWLNPLPERCRGIDIAQLRQDVFVAHEALIGLGPDRIGEFDRSLFKPILFETV